jgi:hypothetical protein
MGSFVNADNVMNLIISFLLLLDWDYLPGLLNMTAAKWFERREKKCLLVVFSSSDNHFFQAYLAILFARVIDIRPDIVILLKWVLVYLSFNVLFFALKPLRKQKKAVKKRFFLECFFPHLISFQFHTMFC